MTQNLSLVWNLDRRHPWERPVERIMTTGKGGRPRAGGSLTPEHARVIDAWMLNPNKSAISKGLNMSEGKIDRILKLPLVKEVIDERTADLLAQAGMSMRIAVPKAFQVVNDLMGESYPPQVRFRAASLVLGRLPDLPPEGSSAANDVIEERLGAVDEQLDEENQAGG